MSSRAIDFFVDIFIYFFYIGVLLIMKSRDLKISFILRRDERKWILKNSMIFFVRRQLKFGDKHSLTLKFTT